MLLPNWWPKLSGRGKPRENPEGHLDDQNQGRLLREGRSNPGIPISILPDKIRRHEMDGNLAPAGLKTGEGENPNHRRAIGRNYPTASISA